MPAINVYLTFDGNCEEAFNFYREAFGGEFGHVGRFSEMPSGSGEPVPPEHADRIMHISLPISRETVLMGSDAGGEWARNYQRGNNFAISISAGSREEADRLFTSLSDGGRVNMPLQSTFWGDYFGMWTDKYGVNWMVSFNENAPQ